MKRFLTAIVAAFAFFLAGAAHAQTTCNPLYVSYMAVADISGSAALYVGMDTAPTTGTSTSLSAPSFYILSSSPEYATVYALAALAMTVGKPVYVVFSTSSVSCSAYTTWRTDMTTFLPFGGR